MVRREPLSGLSLLARAFGRDGRGAGRIRPPPDSRRIGLCRRGRTRCRGAAGAGLSRQPLFLRLSGLPEPRRPEAAPRTARRRGDRRHPLRGRPARARAIDLGHRRPPPAGEILLGVRTDDRKPPPHATSPVEKLFSAFSDQVARGSRASHGNRSEGLSTALFRPAAIAASDPVRAIALAMLKYQSNTGFTF